MTFQVGTGTTVRAHHVMPGAEGPEGEQHAHDYRIEVVVARSQLDDRGMVCDLDVLNLALEETVSRIRDVDLEVIRPREAEAVTVEVFARWAHDALAQAVRMAGGEALAVRVWESETAFGGYTAPVA